MLPGLRQEEELAIYGYETNTMAQLVDRLKEVDRPEVLDLGPLSGSNLDFLAGQMGFRVRVDDLSRDSEGHLDRAAERLDLPSNHFHGILVWDLLDHLDPEAVRPLVKRLWAALRPGGLLMAFFGQRLTPRARVQQYNIVDKGRIIIRETAVEAPCRAWPNREVFDLFNGFETLNSLILKSGSREFIFRRPSAATWTLDQ